VGQGSVLARGSEKWEREGDDKGRARGERQGTVQLTERYTVDQDDRGREKEKNLTRPRVGEDGDFYRSQKRLIDANLFPERLGQSRFRCPLHQDAIIDKCRLRPATPHSSCPRQVLSVPSYPCLPRFSESP
jgi:hypothetical protein